MNIIFAKFSNTLANVLYYNIRLLQLKHHDSNIFVAHPQGVYINIYMKRSL